jgi:ABC-type phosphate transport system substrate-binding protein
MIGWRTGAVLATVALGAAVVIAAGVAPPSRASASGTPPFKVIVNPANPISALDRKFLADVFLKKVTRWGNGEVVHPVDLRSDSPVRQQFSDEILRRSVSAVKSFWQQLVFSGRDVPPPEVDSDEQVVKYVLRFEGGVGYVSGAAGVDRVKPVAVK